MIGLYSIVDDEAIKEELAAHIATHKSALLDEDYYAQIGNHALHQNNALLSAALFFDDQAALDVSLNRIKALCAASVDEEGVCTEGAPAYHAFNAHWIHQTLGRLQFATEFYSIPMPVIQDMRPFTAQCIAPDGFYVPFGDTFMGRSPLATEFRARFGEAYCAYLMESPELAFALTMGREGCPPKASLAVFKEGYCFSRRRHNDDPASDSLCAMRFGAGLTTRVHAHDDGGSLVYYPRGMRLLEDGGMYGYYGGRYRTFVQSTMAHNVVTSFSKKYYRSAVNELTYAESTEESDIIEVKVQALEKSRWSRKILHHKLHDCLFVEDVIASTDDSLFQNWNFSEGISVVNVLKNRIDVEGERIRASLLWLCDDIRLEISCGRSNPMLGWASSDESEIHRILSIQAWARKDAAKLPVLIFPLNPAMDFESLCLKDVTLRTRQTQFTITLDGRDLNFNLSIPA